MFYLLSVCNVSTCGFVFYLLVQDRSCMSNMRKIFDTQWDLMFFFQCVISLRLVTRSLNGHSWGVPFHVGDIESQNANTAYFHSGLQKQIRFYQKIFLHKFLSYTIYIWLFLGGNQKYNLEHLYEHKDCEQLNTQYSLRRFVSQFCIIMCLFFIWMKVDIMILMMDSIVPLSQADIPGQIYYLLQSIL